MVIIITTSRQAYVSLRVYSLMVKAVTVQKSGKLIDNILLNLIGPQELKVFVDLAMISAGESDQEIDRISFMHTSCLGFGSLIFGLETDHGFQQLMDLCQPVWQAVQANRNLPDQLVSIHIYIYIYIYIQTP